MKTRMTLVGTMLIVVAFLIPPITIDSSSRQIDNGSFIRSNSPSKRPTDGSNVVFFCNLSHIGRTDNIDAVSPTWVNITPSNIGVIADCIPDPWLPEEKMWAVSSTGIWKGERLNTVTPAWTLLQTTDQIRASTDGHTQNGSEPDRIIASMSIPDTVFVLYSHGGLGSIAKTWVGRSTDGGTTWSWNQAAAIGEQARDFGFAITHNVVSPDQITVWVSIPRDQVYKSTNGGKTFQQILSFPSTAHWYQPHAMYSPLRTNDGSILYVGGGSPSIYRTLNAGTSWTNITPIGSDSQPRGPIGKYEIAGPAWSSSQLYVLVQRPVDVYGENKKLYYSSNGGSSWSLRYDFATWQFDVVGLGINAVDENRLYVLHELESVNPNNLIFLSNDGGVSWIDKSGNWKSIIEASPWQKGVAIWDTGIGSPSTQLITPSNWTMVLSGRPTFRWPEIDGVSRYSIEIYRYRSTPPLTGIWYNYSLNPSETRDPANPGFHRLRLPEDTWLTSGTTAETGGYIWELKAFSPTNVLLFQNSAVFQIPSLGGNWDAIRSELCKNTHCDFPDAPNMYWNKYDDLIYRWSEQWDIPPALMKAIMIGETGSALGPRRICWIDRCDVFPPSDAYLYEPYWDYTDYIAKYGSGKKAIDVFLLPDNPPTDTYQGLGPYNFPYGRQVISGTTIYRYATGIGYPYSVPAVAKIPGCENPNDDCPAKTHTAQYRNAASYGLGQIFYMWHHMDLDNFIPFVAPGRSDPPEKVPPEELYKPDLNINYIGYYLSKLRCSTSDTKQLGASHMNYETWVPAARLYNGGRKSYGVMVADRAYRFAQPISVKQGLRPTFQFESAGHDCNNLFGGMNKLVSSVTRSQLSLNIENELYGGEVSLRDDGAKVWLALSVLQENPFGTYKGIIRLFNNQMREILLWNSPWIENVQPMAGFRVTRVGSHSFLLVHWASGAHAVRAYPVQWDGSRYGLVPTLDFQGSPTDGIGSDGGGVFVSGNFIGSLDQTYGVSSNQRQVTEWSYGLSGFQQTRTYLISWGITNIYLPFIKKTQ